MSESDVSHCSETSILHVPEQGDSGLRLENSDVTVCNLKLQPISAIQLPPGFYKCQEYLTVWPNGLYYL